MKSNLRRRHYTFGIQLKEIGPSAWATQDENECDSYSWTIDHFRIAVTDFYNDSGLNLYSVSFTMKLNIPKFQCNFIVFTTACIVGGVTSRSLSQVFLNIYQQNETNSVKLSPLSLQKAPTTDAKMVYCKNKNNTSNEKSTKIKNA